MVRLNEFKCEAKMGGELGVFNLPQNPNSSLFSELEEISLAEIESGPMTFPVFWQVAQPNLYAAWKNRFVYHTATGGVFVIDPSEALSDPLHEGRITSESMAFGLLLAVQNNDYVLFNSLLNSLNADMKQRGLPVWEGYIDNRDNFVIGPRNKQADGSVNYNASASDADIQIGLALIQAYQKAENGEYGWRVGKDRYKEMAEETLDLIWKFDVFDGQEYTILKSSNADPGPGASIGAMVNPSYFSFAAFGVFARFDNERSHRWIDLKMDCYEILDTITENGIIVNGNGQEILLWQREPLEKFTQIPNWVTVWYKEGAYQVRATSEKEAKQGRDSNQGFDALRTFWQIALDALWHKDEHAIRLARRLIDQLERRGITDPRNIPVFDSKTQSPICGPRVMVLAVYAALAQAAATPIQSAPGTKPSSDQAYGVDERYITWANKTANLFTLTFQTAGDKDGPFFMDENPASSYYDQTTGTIVSMILGKTFSPVFSGQPNPLSKTAETLMKLGPNHLVYHANLFLSMVDDSQRAKLNDIVGAYRMLEGEEDPSLWKNMEVRFQLARSLAAFGFKQEAIEQYKIILSVANPIQTNPQIDPLYYEIVLSSYVEIKALIKENESAASGIRRFKEIAKANPGNPFARLGQAQFLRELYSLPGYMRSMEICDQLLSESIPPEIQMEAYRLKAESLFQVYLVEYGEATEGIVTPQQTEQKMKRLEEKQVEALEYLVLAQRIPGIENATFKEGLLITEAEFYRNKARIDMERQPPSKESTLKAQAEYQKALDIYQSLLAWNNNLYQEAPLREKAPFRQLAQFVLLQVIDLHIKMGEVEEQVWIYGERAGEATQDLGLKGWREKAKDLLFIASTGGEVVFPNEKEGRAEWQFRKAVRIVETGFEKEGDLKKRTMQRDKWRAALQVKKVSIAKLFVFPQTSKELTAEEKAKKIREARLSAFNEVVQEYKEFLMLAPTGKWRFIFEKAEYNLKGRDYGKMEQEGATYREAIKRILDYWGNPAALLRKGILSSSMNTEIRIMLDLIRSGQWEKARQKLRWLVAMPTEVELSNRGAGFLVSEKSYDVSPEVAIEMSAWSDNDLEFVVALQDLFYRNGSVWDISEIEIFLTENLQKDDLIKSYTGGDRSFAPKEKEKLEAVLKLLEDLQLEIHRRDARAAAKIIEYAIRNLEEEYEEYPYDPEWTEYFKDAYYVLVAGARGLEEDRIARELLLTGYAEMMGQPFWGEEYDFLKEAEETPSSQTIPASLKEVLDKARQQTELVLRDQGISNLMFTTFSNKPYLKVGILKTIAGIIWDKNRCASFAIHQQAATMDPENLEINAKMENQEPFLSGTCKGKLGLKKKEDK